MNSEGTNASIICNMSVVVSRALMVGVQSEYSKHQFAGLTVIGANRLLGSRVSKIALSNSKKRTPETERKLNLDVGFINSIAPTR